MAAVTEFKFPRLSPKRNFLTLRLQSKTLMAQLRLRHPKGVATIQIDLESATVQDLLQEIYKITEILPSHQDGMPATFDPPRLTLMCVVVKVGYPPKSLTLIPELPISSLGLSKGEQLIVNQNSRGSNAKSTTGTSSPGIVPQPSPRPPAPAQPTANEPDSVETEGGYLVHTVRPCTSLRCRVADLTGQVVPDDNSCLFSSVAIVFEQNIGKAQDIRKSALNCSLIKLILKIRSRSR